MNRRDALIIAGLYLLGIALTAWYVFGTQYLTVSDTAREFDLFIRFRSESYGAVYHDVINNVPEYALQVSCIFTTYLPAQLSRLIPIDPVLFLKLYHVIVVPVLPVLAYCLVRSFLNKRGSMLAALFIMGWGCFLQGASMARNNIAMIFFSLGLFLIF